MIKKIAFIFICLVLFSCSEEKEQTMPVDILSKQKMAEVMIDVHLLEAAMNLNTYRFDPKTKGNSATFDVFTKNKITKKMYDDSFEYYTQQPEQLTEIYQIVLENLSKMQAKVMSRKEEKKIIHDTIYVTDTVSHKKLNPFKRRNK
jgi:Domain of unknown function (DUF4296)